MSGLPTTDPSNVQQAARNKHVFAIPASLLKFADGYTHIGLYELTPQEELNATKRVRGEVIRLAFELAKESFRFIGKKDTAGQFTWLSFNSWEGTADAQWAKMHPKIRGLVIAAYNDVHNPKESETTSFIQSQEIHAG